MLTTKLRQSVCAIALCLVSCLLVAKSHVVEVQLVQIEAVKTADEKGDAVYFSIAAYPTECAASLDRVPVFPTHWLSKELSDIKNATLWKGNIADEVGVLLIFTLLAQEVEMLESDRLIGSVSVQLTNNGGNISSVWSQPDFVDQPRVDQRNTLPEYMMFGDQSQYLVKFAVKVK